MIIYGLHGFNHGGAKALTAGADVITNAGPGRLTQYLEKRAGALARLIEAHGVIMLDRPAWDAKKAELGDTVLR